MVPRVFIPQITQRYSPEHERMVSSFDFSHAATFGQLTVILDHESNSEIIDSVMPMIKNSLESFTENDFFVAVGDPVVIAACAGLILRKFKSVKMLKWDKKLRAYLLIEVKP